MTTIRYFIPEDGDEEMCPNVFLVPKGNQTGFSPRLKDVKDAFPLPGKYHFRFKSPIIPGTDREKNAVPVWMDCVNDEQHVAVWRNTIFAKVTRITPQEDSDDDFDQFEHTASNNNTNTSNGYTNNGYHHTEPSPSPIPQHSASSSSAAPSPNNSQPPSVIAESDSLLGVFDSTPHTNNHSHHSNNNHSNNNNNSHPPSTSSSTADLLNVVVDAPPAPPTTVNSEGSLLDMSSPHVYPNHSTSKASDDFLGMTATPVVSHAPAPVAPRSAPVAAPAPVTPAGPMGYPPAPQSQAQKKPAGNAFEAFSDKAGPFGGLEWK